MHGKRLSFSHLSIRHTMRVFACAIAASMISTPAAAVMISAPYGWFIEANVGSTDLSGDDWPGDVSSSGVGGNVNVGYKFMPFFGIEGGYTRYANTTIRDINDTKAGSVKYYSYDLAIRGILPIVDSGFELFAKVGAGRIGTSVDIKDDTAANSIGLSSSSRSATGLFLGIGGQYYFMPELAVVAQWQRVEGSNSTGSINLFSLGLSFIVD